MLRSRTLFHHDLPAHEGLSVEIRDCADALTAWHAETWPQAHVSTAAAPVALTLEDRDILDMLQREGTAARAPPC